MIDLKTKKALVLEPDTWFREFLSEVCVQQGMVVQAISDAYEVFDALDNFQPDILIMDIILPDSTGFTILNEKISHEDLAKIPTIVVSGLKIASEQLGVYGVGGFLDKNTMTPESLVAEIRKNIR